MTSKATPKSAKAPARQKAAPATAPNTQLALIPEAPAAPKAKAPAATYNLGTPHEVDALAVELKGFVATMKLSTTVQGKEFVNVEAWQYAGSRLGIVPIMGKVKCTSTDTELRYTAAVTLLNLRTGQTVGGGFAVCSSKEPGRKFYQEFAIASMAQTRAIGKAFRNCIAWMIRAAGYEPVPTEELDYNTNTTQEPATPMTVAQSTDAPAVAVEYATAAQKEEIIRLVSHAVITQPEKTKMLLNINRMDGERATVAINKLKKAIDYREGGKSAAA